MLNNFFNFQKLYKLGWEEALKKGYDLPVDAISVQLAKVSRDNASDVSIVWPLPGCTAVWIHCLTAGNDFYR